MAFVTESDVMIDAHAHDKWSAIQLVGERLVAAGRVHRDYIKAMLQREREATTYIGNGVAIPHGTAAAKDFVLASGLSIAQFPGGLDFGDGNRALLVIGIAGRGDEHLDLLATIAERCEHPDAVKRLANLSSARALVDAMLGAG